MTERDTDSEAVLSESDSKAVQDEVDLSVTGCKVFDAAVAVGNVAMIRTLLQDARIDTADHERAALIHWVCNENSEMLKCLLVHGNINPSFDNNQLLRLAVKLNRTPAVRLLLDNPCIDPSAMNDHLLRFAVGHNNIETTRLLLADPRIDPSCMQNEPLRMAVTNKNIDMVRLLLTDPRVDPSYNDQACLEIAIHTQCIDKEIIRTLFADPRVDPSIDDQELFIECVYRDQAEVLELFLAHPRIDPTTDNNFAFEMACDEGCHAVLRVMWANESIWQAHCAKPHGMPTSAFDRCWQADLRVVMDYAAVCTKLYGIIVVLCGPQPAIRILALRFCDKLVVRGGPTQFQRATRLLSKLCH